MDETVEVQLVDTTLEVSLKDKLAVTVLSALACMATGSLVEKGYFNAKARSQTRNVQTNTK